MSDPINTLNDFITFVPAAIRIATTDDNGAQRTGTTIATDEDGTWIVKLDGIDEEFKASSGDLYRIDEFGNYVGILP